VSQHPVKATWVGTEEESYHRITGQVYSAGRVATIWLDQRSNGEFEVWKWRTVYPSGATDELGWGPTYRSCKEQLPFPCKMRRVDEKSQ
jgi:hypothetical protein